MIILNFSGEPLYSSIPRYCFTLFKVCLVVTVLLTTQKKYLILSILYARKRNVYVHSICNAKPLRAVIPDLGLSCPALVLFGARVTDYSH